MNRIFTAALVLNIAAMLFATDLFAQNKEKRDMPGAFNKIEVSKGANVTISQCDANEGLEIATDGCPTSDVETLVNKGTLIVRMKKRTPGSAVQVIVNCKDFNEIDVKRGATLETSTTFQHKGRFVIGVGAQSEVIMDLEVDELVVDAHTCNIKLQGKATKQNVNIAGTVGSSKYDAEDLVSEDVIIKAVDSEAVVNATRSLEANAISCTIRYKGNPANVREVTTGNGLVEKM